MYWILLLTVSYVHQYSHEDIKQIYSHRSKTKKQIGLVY